ncbi:MAG: OmpH family outer membrane protein [Candidatus Aminicenantes bacterium]|nr:OmpH family outer membrane protein [Candidatus Aminicenantes bacterium]
MSLRSTSKIVLIPLVVLAILVTLGYSQQAVKIGVVNSQDVLEKSAEGKRVMAQIQDKDKQNQSRLGTLDEDIRNLETRINTQRLTLTNEAMMQLSSDLEKKRTERKRFAEDSLREMQEFTGRLFQRVQTELLPIIEQVGKEKNLDIILDLARSGAIYFNPTIDLTQEVITKYDASKASR